MNRKQCVGIGVVVLVGAVLGFLIITSEQRPVASDDHGHDHDAHGHAAAEHKHDHGKAEKSGSRKPHDHAAHAGESHKDHGDDHGKPAGAAKSERHRHHDTEHGHDHDEHEAEVCEHSGQEHDHGIKKAPEKRLAHLHPASTQRDPEEATHTHSTPSSAKAGSKGHDHRGHVHHSDAGPHGGRILEDGNFRVEVTIFEKGVPPQFRVYCYEQEAPVNTEQVKLTMELRRPGGVVTLFHFRPDADYLVGDKVVEEPHSFRIRLVAEWGGKKHSWEYAQVDGQVELSDEAARLAGIEIVSAGPQRIASAFELPGEVSFNADMLAHVVPRVAGVIACSLKNLGDVVKKGELLAVIESREMAEAKSRYLVFMKREELARTTFERTEALWKKAVTSEQAYLNDKKALEEAKIELMAAGQKLLALGLSEPDLLTLSESPAGSLNRYELHAPFDGVVVKKRMAIGEWVTENRDLMVLADLSSVWVEVIVYVKDLDLVRLGQKAKVRLDSSGLDATGVVSYIGPLVGEDTRTARARVVIPNPKGRWRPGLFVTVQLAEDEAEVPVAVRTDAIQTLDDWSVVFVRCGDRFEPRPVQLGRRNGKFVEVVQGLSAGEKYAARNSFLLKSQLGIGGLSHCH